MLTSLLIAILVPWIHGQEFAAVYSEHDVKLEGHVINSTSTSSLFHCMQECESTNNCHSINLYNNARPSICELNDANHLTNPESMVNSSGSTYLNYFPRPVSKCSNSLCRNSSYDCIVESDGINYKCKLIPRKSMMCTLEIIEQCFKKAFLNSNFLVFMAGASFLYRGNYNDVGENNITD